MAARGQKGDAFGVLNSMFTALTLSVVCATFLEQLRSARVARVQAERALERQTEAARVAEEQSRQAFALQAQAAAEARAHAEEMLELERESSRRIREDARATLQLRMDELDAAKKQIRHEVAERRFEQTKAMVFDMLRLVRDLSGAVVWRSDAVEASGEVTGPAALDRIADDISAAASSLVGEDIVRASIRAYAAEFDRQVAGMGPYWRMLFQTFGLIDEADISDKEKDQLSKIVRGQLSEGAVLLLALNGLTPTGGDFVPYCQKFGLLEHLGPRYKPQYRAHFLLAYTRDAFLGSKKRGDPRSKAREGRRPDPRYFWPSRASRN
jgi:hypothetical protein